MDHKEQHHEHHRHERDEKKKHEREYEDRRDKKLLPVHPLWLLVVGIALIGLALAVWTFFIW